MTVLQPQTTALITGAASGVGLATAKIYRNRGMHLALLDIDAASLERQNKRSPKWILRSKPRPTSSMWIRSTFCAMDLVMLNAGKEYKPQSSALEGRVMPWGYVEYWKKAYIRHQCLWWTERPQGNHAPPAIIYNPQIPKSIVVTGSKQGIISPPPPNTPPWRRKSGYNASKAAIKSLTEHLAHDLRSDSTTARISMHLLVPGWTWTGLMGNVGPKAESEVKKTAGAWYPSQVAEELVKGLEKGSFYIICPDDETNTAMNQARVQ
ncbi:short chain dehydrogenase reductase [Aspergillus sclerotialis]|uniref:Short chain dehydrogenase reductase n=1 Tax=Aspergillus sclerotialis TaxID=2070753 RepID=A0A3A2ZYD1_9EURO|nr:short chain dehydrogenase reductase [Aspergillus sclerotialis]